MAKTPVILDDVQSHDVLKQIATGRTEKEMGAMIHAAHEATMLETERAKFADLSASLSTTTQLALVNKMDGVSSPVPSDLDAISEYLLDGEGTYHIDVALGLAMAALQNRDADDFTFKLYGLFKACVLGLPHVQQLLQATQQGESK